jgi:hypothetical protein
MGVGDAAASVEARAAVDGGDVEMTGEGTPRAASALVGCCFHRG